MNSIFIACRYKEWGGGKELQVERIGKDWDQCEISWERMMVITNAQSHWEREDSNPFLAWKCYTGCFLGMRHTSTKIISYCRKLLYSRRDPLRNSHRKRHPFRGRFSYHDLEVILQQNFHAVFLCPKPILQVHSASLLPNFRSRDCLVQLKFFAEFYSGNKSQADI